MTQPWLMDEWNDNFAQAARWRLLSGSQIGDVLAEVAQFPGGYQWLSAGLCLRWCCARPSSR